MIRRRGLALLGLLAIVLLFAVPSSAVFYTDWLWFREVGYASVFLRTFSAESWVFAATFAAVFAVLYANLRFARSSIRLPRIVLGKDQAGRPIVVEGGTLSSWSTPVALIVAGLMAWSASMQNWLDWLSFLHQVPFGTPDPLFHRDPAFYVFSLPIYQTVRDQALVVAWLALIGSGLIYVLSGSFVLEARYGVAFWPRISLAPTARRHLGLLGAAVFGILAWGAWLDIFRLVLSPSTVVFGAAYADVYARLPFQHATIAVLIVGAGLSVVYGFTRRGWVLPVAVGGYIVVLLSGGLYASIIQNFVVTPNEQDKEQPYILNNISATRRAYALDHVDERELSGDAALTPVDIARNADTIENVRLWDHGPLLQTFSQIQEIRTYYDFKSVDNDRYRINGKYRQVMLSARELNTEHLTTRSWVNEHLSYTHGYGLTLGPVNQVTTEGLPVLFIRNLPPETTVHLTVDEPSIYFGELSNDYVLVGTRTPEFHYPRGEENVMTTYRGLGGIPIGGFVRKLLFALRFGSTDILVTNQITKDSRIMFNRQIAKRVQLLAPFLNFDADPYPVLTNGRLIWLQDAYTTTDNYPYSSTTQTKDGEINYIRNSVKISIDAYDGTTTFYLAEPNDPLALTISNVFPGMLRPMSDMPKDLQQHVRYPEEIFKIQAAVFATFHMTKAQVFYSKEDQWEVPALDSGGTATRMQPYYTVMKLPGQKDTEFIQMLPFTPRAKPNLAAWLVARSDGEHYGHLLVFQFPKQKIVYGPQQIVGRINQDQVISPQITLWDQQGSKVIWGTLLVIPIEESLLYVRPLYLQSAEGKIPELKRVIVAYQSQIVMDVTLRQALIQIFGREIATALPADQLQSTATSVVPSTSAMPEAALAPGAPAVAEQPASLAELAAEAQTHLDRADKALREGDWAAYGEEMKKVRETVARMTKFKK
jgi:uncharacterized membrane protein (UPF0182 family)